MNSLLLVHNSHKGEPVNTSSKLGLGVCSDASLSVYCQETVTATGSAILSSAIGTSKLVHDHASVSN